MSCIKTIRTIAEEMCDLALSDPILKPFMKAKGKFDVLIVENFANECFMGFAHALDLPMIQVRKRNKNRIWIILYTLKETIKRVCFMLEK